MNDEPITDPKKNRGAFVREVFEQEGIPFLWRQTLKSLGITDQYSEILIKYTPWLNHIKQALKSHFAAGVEFTYNNWNIAKELEKKIIEPNPKIDSYPEIVAILNAAWTARWQHPESIEDIQINALRLLAKDQSLLEPLQPKSGSGPGRAPVSTAPTKRSLITEERGSLTTEECINIVQGALFDKVDQKAINLFSLMKKTANFYNCNDIEDILKDNEKAVKAFQQLCDAKSQSKF